MGRMMEVFRYHEPSADIHAMAESIRDKIEISYVVGEGWLIPFGQDRKLYPTPG